MSMMLDQTSDSIENQQLDVSENGAPQQLDAEMMIETKLTDINIDCQEHVFKHLGLLDLLNIADSSKQFKTAADLVFAKKFGNERVKVLCIRPCRNQYVESNESIEWIEFAKTGLQLFRNFGHLISVLNFEPANVLAKTPREESFSLLYKCAIEYINEYLAESLTEIWIRQCPEGFLKFLNPLLNISTVEIDSFGFEGLSNDWLKTLFPKLNRLTYIDFNQSLGMIDHHFPHLEHLSVRRGYSAIAWDNISPAVLDLNSQLRSLFNFDIGPGVNVLRSMERLQHLEELDLMWDMKYANARNEFDGEIFRFRTIKMFKIFTMDTSREYGTFPKIPFVFDQLEKCAIHAKASSFDELYKFLERNPTITDLKLQLNCLFVNLSKIAQASRSLRHFKFRSHAFITKENIVDFIDSLPVLNQAYFTVQLIPNDCLEQLKQYFSTHLENEWHVSVEEVNDFTKITLERLD
ncbi:uncharacterized protein LOC129576435 isoform X1 [Sitodiplosis mosellana]|uniref:uncharacterized protein LOC129576435 isoform X1 n=1 Tax=Sitodiplosis mosellana TaxID=263140 RepID=UPI002444D18C|nr:uncharacterized protein LOC129576435 isoform X1 [Sitodiplosis mosellana]